MFRNPWADALVVLVIVLLIFGPKRLPGLGKQLGHGLREFKEGITGESKEEESGQPELTAATPSAEPAATPAQPQAAPVPQAPTPGSGSDRESAEVGSPDRRV